MANRNILLPQGARGGIYVFVDETYLANDSGFLQAAIPMYRPSYHSQVVPDARKILKRLGRNAREFKGSRIKKGNQVHYKDFVKSWMPSSLELHDDYDISPIISLTSNKSYTDSDPDFKWLYDNISGGLSNIGVSDPAIRNLVKDFTQSMIWLVRHGEALLRKRVADPYTFIFDSRFSASRTMSERRWVSTGYGAIPAKVQDVMTSIVRTLLVKFGMLKTVAEVAEFKFVDSHEMFGVQAADLIANLMLSEIRHRLGSMAPPTILRSEMLQYFVPELTISDDILKELSLSTLTGGEETVELTNDSLGGRWTLHLA